LQFFNWLINRLALCTIKPIIVFFLLIILNHLNIEIILMCIQGIFVLENQEVYRLSY
jgi:hypothetical protein